MPDAQAGLRYLPRLNGIAKLTFRNQTNLVSGFKQPRFPNIQTQLS